jgi:hypothetical protein
MEVEDLLKLATSAGASDVQLLRELAEEHAWPRQLGKNVPLGFGATSCVLSSSTVTME